MKLNYLLYLIIGLSIGHSVNAYEVSTTLQKRNVLLEEFTGIRCGYCPQGHAIARNIQSAQEGSVYVIAIHSGMYASPSLDEPDFRTKDGDIINNTIGAGYHNTGYPSAMTNRHMSEKVSLVTERSSWAKNLKESNQQNAPVNLLLKSTFDGNTRQLKIYVEGYYTENVQQSFNLLNVAIIQNNIKGPQNGGAMGSDYIHNHMLRDYITPVWGDTIKASKRGDYFTRNYTYTLPRDIKDVELKVEDIELIAFICEDKTEILNVTGGKPVYTNYDKEINATLLSPEKEIKNNYGFNFFEAKLRNESSQTITSAEFQITINDNTQTAYWNGEITAFEIKSITIEVSPYSYNTTQQNSYSVSLTKLNGQSINGNSLSGSFSSPKVCTPLINIELQTDMHADENRFIMRDQNGNVVKELGPYQAGEKSIYNESVTLEQGKIYCFEVIDEWGDGIQQPRGYYKLINKEDQTMIAQQYDIKSLGDRFFFHTSLTADIINSDFDSKTNVIFNSGSLKVSFVSPSSSYTKIELYSTTGQKINTDAFYTNAMERSLLNIPAEKFPSGIYFIRISRNDQHETVKIIIK